ncbi:SRPBCC domain-containing protein [Sandaracinus amylolyticus]|uniref:SRPBCC domain-containing protein n=1 Tax=Sandaracinus amylolyticus TaxID=927083 RepID=UPI001F481E3D|nr:SRPBCC domain-containing protein [Sandaracinus amylolyticus]UJR78188.1 Polyketide cyclase / dehydrase and lipid transport [Sandaracinus amylolyticus]
MPRAIIEASSEIDAPPERVWSILVDLTSYAEWNPFTPRIDASLRVGEPVVLHVAMTPGRPRLVQHEVCTANDASKHELGWGTTMLARFVLHANRVQRLEPLPGGRTRYYTADEFEGLLVPVVMWLYRSDIQRGFDGVARALKAYAERA